MWISSYVGLVENELVDDRARHQAALKGSIFDRPFSPSDFQSSTGQAYGRKNENLWILEGLPILFF
jgi:hypothetical protein